MCINEEKARLRKFCIRYRASLADKEKTAFDSAITAKVLQSEAYLSAQMILCYVSLPREISTRGILSDAFKRGRRVAVPRCRKHGLMDFYILSSSDDLESGMLGIPEPKHTCEMYIPKADDLCIVPCLSADKRGFRLGYGGGYYDRYLSAHAVRTIGLCYSALIETSLPTDRYDVPVHRIITEKEVS